MTGLVTLSEVLNREILKLMEGNEEHINQSVQVARLWSQAQGVVAAMVSGAVIDFHDAEDLVARVAETVVRNFGEYDRSRPFLPWALGIARNIILQYYERRSGEKHIYFDESTLRVLEIAHINTADDMSARLAALQECLKSITGKTRHVLEMRYMHNLRPDVLAETMGISRNSVWLMLSRGRDALKKCIEKKLRLES
jgi:RNA polymerase sigma-70 factor, ECF subfamily